MSTKTIGWYCETHDIVWGERSRECSLTFSGSPPCVWHELTVEITPDPDAELVKDMHIEWGMAIEDGNFDVDEPLTRMRSALAVVPLCRDPEHVDLIRELWTWMMVVGPTSTEYDVLHLRVKAILGDGAATPEDGGQP